VVALVRPDVSPRAENVWLQYQYEPYGAPVAADVSASAPADLVNRIGHQGLFFERFCVWATDSVYDRALQPDDPATAHRSIGLYYNRNRWYSPELGRFVQRDMNAAALPIIEALARNGEALDVLLGAFDTQDHFGDGMSLYGYVASNPVRRSDPGGLEWGMEDDIDTAISDRTGQALYSLATINEGAKWASLGLQATLSIAWSLLPGSGLYDAFQSVQLIANGKGGFWDAMNIAMAAMPLARRGIEGLAGLRGLSNAFSWGIKACNCFVAGTKVETPNGSQTIECLAENDQVLTVDERYPGGPAQIGHVTRVFRNVAPTILWLTLSNGSVLGTTPGHQVWTFQDGWMLAGQLDKGDTLANRCGLPVTILEVTVDPTPTLVYNLMVDGTFTYFADGVWVHNNSCTVAGRALAEVHHLLPLQFADRFEDVGLKVKDFAMRIEREFHRKLHGKGGKWIDSWNAEWKRFWDKYPRTGPAPDKQTVLNHYADLFNKFFLE